MADRTRDAAEKRKGPLEPGSAKLRVGARSRMERREDDRGRPPTTPRKGRAVRAKGGGGPRGSATGR